MPHPEIASLLDFINATPTPHHIKDGVLQFFNQQSQQVVSSSELVAGKIAHDEIYFLTKNGAAAFFRYKDISEKTRFHIWGAHSDSPTLKIKSNSNLEKNNLNFLKTEVYGGPILSTWLDRTFSLAGKVYYKEAKVLEKTIHWKIPLLTIPNAAIHINRDVNKGFKIDREKHLPALLSSEGKKLEELLARELKVSEEAILAYDLQLVPLEPPHLIGYDREMIHSPRLDNLLMCHAGLAGFQESLSLTRRDEVIPVVVFFNHEEIGSNSAEGAFSVFLENILTQMLEGSGSGLSETEKNKIISNSFFISADVAHAFHPQYSDLYEEGNNILLGKGVVIKHSSNRNYVSDSQNVAYVKNLLLEKEISFQEANSHGEIPCGKTIGPIVNTRLGVSTLDVGSPLLAMHSLKELGSVTDHLEMIKLAREFFAAPLE